MTPAQALRHAADELDRSRDLVRDRSEGASLECATIVVYVRSMCAKMLVDMSMCLAQFPEDIQRRAVAAGPKDAMQIMTRLVEVDGDEVDEPPGGMN